MQKLGLATILAMLAIGLAHAQPYYPPPAYNRPPPGYYERGPGFHCEAFFRTPAGPRRLFCPISSPAPIGVYCVCEPPEPPPGYPPLPPARGHVVR